MPNKEFDDKEQTEKILFCKEDVETPIRVDSFLLTQFPDYSRSFFQKLIADDLVKVNNKPVSKSFLVKSGDKIEVFFPKPELFTVEPYNIQFEVIDKQKDFLIINKPAGLTVHHTKELQKEPTLVSGLLYRFKEFGEFEDTERPGIVHRLDKQTSGLLVVARNIRAQIEFSRLFKQRLVSKTYLAVVRGHPDVEGKIDLPIGRHPVERHKMSHVSYSGRPALTYYKVLNYYKKSKECGDCALVSISLVTGRTHQIRVHFASIGHGLLGDSLYGVQAKLIKRQALHAWKMSFEYYEKKFHYCASVPDDFRRLLSYLKNNRIVL